MPTPARSSPLFTEAARANAELHSAHEDYCRVWERRKHEAGEEAFHRYIGESLEQQRVSIPSGFAFMGGLTSIAQPLGGAVYTQANEAAAGARADFERREPRKSLDKFQKELQERTQEMMTAEMLAYERFKAGRKKYPGVRRLSFRSTPRGWVVRPTDGAKAGSWREQQVALEQALLSSQLAAIRNR